MADSSEIEDALVTKLEADTGVGGLLTLMTDGVFIDEAPKGRTNFVIVSLSASHDEDVQSGNRSIEHATYLVKAVARNTSGLTVKSAAARIDALLNNGSLTVTGFTLMLMRRAERVRYTEVDENSDLRWQHRGGLYELTLST